MIAALDFGPWKAGSFLPPFGISLAEEILLQDQIVEGPWSSLSFLDFAIRCEISHRRQGRRPSRRTG